MFLTIDETDRALARKAIELTEKRLEAALTNLAELRLSTMEADRFAGLLSKLRGDIHNTERDAFEWSLHMLETLRVCLSIYRGKLESLRDSQVKLIVPIDDTAEKLRQLEFLHDKITGQERMRFSDVRAEAELVER